MGDNFDASYHVFEYGCPKETCVECGHDATYESPDRYCDEHWARWWGAADGTGRMYREAKFLQFSERLPGPIWWLAWRAYDLMELLFRSRKLRVWERLR